MKAGTPSPSPGANDAVVHMGGELGLLMSHKYWKVENNRTPFRGDFYTPRVEVKPDGGEESCHQAPTEPPFSPAAEAP